MIEIIVKVPGFGDRSIKRFLLDLRSVKADAKTLTDLSRRVTNLAVLPGAVRPAALNRSLFMSTKAHRTKSKQMRQMQQRLAAGDAAGAEKLYGKQIAPALMDSLPWTLQATAESVALSADLAMEKVNAATCTRTFRPAPRVILTTWDAAKARLDFDLGLRACRTLTAPGLPSALGRGAQMSASAAALNAEMQLGGLAGAKPAVSAAGILAAARKRKIPLRGIGPRDLAKVAGLPVSTAVRTLMKEQLACGWTLSVMTRPLKRAGRSDYAWFAFDAKEGILMTFGPEGGDQAAVEFAHSVGCHKFLDWPTSIMVAFDSYLINYAGNMIGMVGSDMSFFKMHVIARFKALALVKNTLISTAAGGPDNYAQYMIGVVLGEMFLAYAYASP